MQAQRSHLHGWQGGLAGLVAQIAAKMSVYVEERVALPSVEQKDILPHITSWLL